MNITTTAELDALPSGAVVLDKQQDAWQEQFGGGWVWVRSPGSSLCLSSAEILKQYGPVTVLFPRPEPTETPTARLNVILLTEGVNMGDHAQDVTRALDVDPTMTIAELVESTLHDSYGPTLEPRYEKSLTIRLAQPVAKRAES